MDGIPSPNGWAPAGGQFTDASAQEVRLHNRALDTAIRAAAGLVPERHLHDEMSDEPRTLAVQLGHLGELSRFAATQLDSWLRGRRVVLGRVPDADADHADALERATLQRLAPLRAEIDAAADALAEVLDRIVDEHLTATVTDVVIGREPVTGYLHRYVLGHKTAHLAQLHRTLVSAGITADRGGSAAKL